MMVKMIMISLLFYTNLCIMISGWYVTFSWNGTTVSHWRFHDNRRMNTSADVSKFKISPFFVFKCWILLKPVLGGVDGNLHFPVPSMNRLNQTEPATFSLLSCWAFFRDSVSFCSVLLLLNLNTAQFLN
jgi:hypothetical protein